MALGTPRVRWATASLVAVLCLAHAATAAAPAPILVVGSLNVDIIVPVHRLPTPGETITARSASTGVAVGGKGANQAVAAARLAAGTGRGARLVCRFGSDAHASMLEAALVEAGVDVTGCGRAPNLPSGQGIVLLEAGGTASSVVLGGANGAWSQDVSLDHLVRDAGLVLLQREIPEHVNLAVAKAAAKAGVPVLQDMGGEDRPISDELLRLLSYISPNESELQRLTGMPTGSEADVVAAATSLIARGTRNVLVTLAERGSVLVRSSGPVLRQEAAPIPGGVVVDGTAAGDAFKAAFAVALVDGLPLQQCLHFAAAAGAVAVSRMGAMPSLPTRAEVLAVLPPEMQATIEAAVLPAAPAAAALAQSGGSGQHSCSSAADESCASSAAPADAGGVPFKFASRLNSMQARRDLVTDLKRETNDVIGWIARQGRVQGLGLVDFNHPLHFVGLTPKKVQAALGAAGLQAGAVCIRFPETFRLGAFTNPEAQLRTQAVTIAVEGCRWAAALGARELVVWSPYDGYDYTFQVDYQAAWRWTVEGFQHLADACPPGVRVSLEFKPTDESTRFSIVPSTGAALLLARDVDRPNFGLTLDVGHLLMAGENPAQSVAAVGAAGKLFGMQLNDAHVKLGAEDGLAFGAVNPVMALELVAWLHKVRYDGHIYYDTFPRKEDPVREAEYNIRRFKALWARALRLKAAGIHTYAAKHDAMGVLELLEAEEGPGTCSPAAS